MQVQDIFLAAIEISDLQERDAYIAKACSGNEALHRKVNALLIAHERSGGFLEVPALQQMAGQQAQGDRRPVDEEMDEDIDLSFLEPSTSPGSLGRLLHYEVQDVVGQGGCGIVLKAFDAKLHRIVAIKIMTPQLAATSPARKRFLREARATTAIRHENVVSIYAVEEKPMPFLVMEYIDGLTLQDKITQTGPLELPAVLSIGQQIARGLEVAHEKGLVHRDIKPANILLERGSDRVKITDFGLARSTDDASLTQSGAISGTPLYMSPEQAQGLKIDHRSDLFSLGSVLYVMCTGRPPFRATTAVAVLKRVVEEQPRPIREVIPEVPAWLISIVTRLHSKQPDGRIPTAGEVASLLAQGGRQSDQPNRVASMSNHRGGQPIPEASRLLSRSGAGSGLFQKALHCVRTLPRRWIISGATIAGLLLASWFLMPLGTESKDAERQTDSLASNEARPQGVVTATSARLPIAAEPSAVAKADPVVGLWTMFIGPPEWPANVEFLDDGTGVVSIDPVVISAMKQRGGEDRSLYKSMAFTWERNADESYLMSLVGGTPIDFRVFEDRAVAAMGGKPWVRQAPNRSPSPWRKPEPIVGLWDITHQVLTGNEPVTVDLGWDGTGNLADPGTNDATKHNSTSPTSGDSQWNWSRLTEGRYQLQHPGNQSTADVTIANDQMLLTDGGTVIGNRRSRKVSAVDRKVVHRGWGAWYGDYLTKDGEFIQTKTGNSKILFGSPDWKDFDLSLEMMTLSGRESGHIIFRGPDSHNFYILYLKDVDGKAAIFKSIQERKTQIAPPVELNAVNNRWYRVEIRARGPYIWISVDGQPVFAFQDSIFSKGLLGLATFGSSAKWRNLTLRHPDGTLLWEGFPEL